MVLSVLIRGTGRLDWGFLTGFPSRYPEASGVLPALVGTVAVAITALAAALPVGIGAAVYLEEYLGRGRWADSRWLRWVNLNIANLASVPTVLFGLLGLAVFVRAFGWGPGLISAALTLAVLFLPLIVIATREALRAVPDDLRIASMALGASRWQTIRHQVLPRAFPGIVTGILLAGVQALGETAPLLVIGLPAYISFLPDGPMSPVTTLPVQIFHWISRPQAGFQANAAAAILLLLPILLGLNAWAIRVRRRASGGRK
jgi:phosphate transport system permease protein